ncbi:MAG: hypothetical protein RLZZ511_913 [Cyanobacteriota bacterium]
MFGWQQFDPALGVSQRGDLACGLGNLPLWMSLQKLFDDRFIFLGMQGAGGVNQGAMRFEPGSGLGEDRGLDLAEFIHRFGGLSPAGIGMAMEGAETGAGRIDQDSIAQSHKFGNVTAIGGFDLDIGKTETIDVLLDFFQAGFGFVHGPDGALVLHQGGDVEGFATGGGAGIDDRFAGLGIEQFGDELSAGILDCPVAFIEAGQGLDRADMLGEAQAVGDVGEWFDVDFGLVELFDYRVDRGFQRVNPQVDRGRLIEPVAEVGGGAGAELVVVDRDDPIGETVGLADLGDRVGDGGEGLVGGTIVLAQEAVDEAGKAGEAVLFGEIDGGVDGGGGGDVVEVAQLVEAEVENEA